VNELLNKYPEEIQKILSRYPADQKRSAVMPLLYLAQSAEGYVKKQALGEIAEILEISATEVASVVGFYTLYHDENAPTAPYRIQVCTDLPCALRGAEEFLHLLCENMGVKVGQPTADGLFVIEEVTCLAGCHRAPLFQVQGDGDLPYYENQTVESAMQVLEALRQHAQQKNQKEASA
jgi:NADH-quinone oxidoreductase E subunit